MLKKVLVGTLMVVALAVAVTGTVLAQDPQPPSGTCPYSGTCGGVGGMGGYGLRGSGLTITADELGMTIEELQVALAEGQTIAEIAESQGVSLEDLVEALIAPHAEMMQFMVDNGFMSQEQADLMLENMISYTTARLEGSGVVGGGCGGGCGGYSGSAAPGGYGGCGMMGGRYGSSGSSYRGSMWGGGRSGFMGKGSY